MITEEERRKLVDELYARVDTRLSVIEKALEKLDTEKAGYATSDSPYGHRIHPPL